MAFKFNLLNFIVLSSAVLLAQACLSKASKVAVSARSGGVAIQAISGRDFNVAGGETLTIAGSGFLPGPVEVLVDSTPCGLISMSNTQIQCRTPALSGVALRTLRLKVRGTTFTHGQKLRYNVVLGQESVSARLNPGLRASMCSPSYAHGESGKFLVTDGCTNRVRIWNSVPSTTFSEPDLVLGQVGLEANDNRPVQFGIVSAATVRSPQGVYTDGSRVIVSDTSSNRLLIWTSFPTQSGQAANLVLGQPSFTESTANNGGVSASSLSDPRGVHSDGTRLAVADRLNHRVLIWNSIPTSSNQPADVVLGQPDMTTATSNNGPNTVACGGVAGRNKCALAFPMDVHFSGGKLYVVDTNNHRVLVWNTIPTVNQTPADVVIGQPSFTAGAANNGPNTVPCGGVAGINNCSLSGPRRVFVAGTALAVADYNNDRVLLYDPIPTTDTPPATNVLGQSSFTSVTANYPHANISAQTLRSPNGGAYVGGKFFVVDTGTHRVLGWNSIPTVAQQAADFVLGQIDFFHYAENGGALASGQLTLRGGGGVAIKGGKLFVMDRNNHRLLIWNSIPSSNNAAPDVLIGQPDLISNKPNNGPNTVACGGVAGLNACSLFGSLDLATDGTRLAVADRYNHRVLIWNSIPAADNTPADLVLGQPDFTSYLPNNGPNTVPCGGAAGRNACSMNGPLSIDTDGTYLAVGDSPNNRVLIWNTFPTVNQQPADVVLGQPDFLSATANNGPATAPCGGVAGLNACGFSGIYEATYLGGKFLVSDLNNRRVLIWNSFPTVNQQPADVVLGQPDFFSSSGLTSAAGISQAMGIEYSGGRLYVADRGNRRILHWSGIPAVNFTPAQGVFGQSSFTSVSDYNPNTTSSAEVGDPNYISIENGVMVLFESGTPRVMLRPVDPDATDY